jgi:hypothetical protein
MAAQGGKWRASVVELIIAFLLKHYEIAAMPPRISPRASEARQSYYD